MKTDGDIIQSMPEAFKEIETLALSYVEGFRDAQRAAGQGARSTEDDASAHAANAFGAYMAGYKAAISLGGEGCACAAPRREPGKVAQ